MEITKKKTNQEIFTKKRFFSIFLIDPNYKEIYKKGEN